MNQDPRVSIILATYNERENICTTIQGIFQHVSDSVEVIVVDDDSPDNTWLVANTLEDRRVKVIRRIGTRGKPGGRSPENDSRQQRQPERKRQYDERWRDANRKEM